MYKERWMDGWMDGWTDGLMSVSSEDDGWMEGLMIFYTIQICSDV